MHLLRRINDLHPEGLCLCAGVILQLDKSTREISLGLILIWMAACLIRGIRPNRKDSANSTLSTAYAIALGILLFQTRTVMEGVNEEGISQFLLIAGGIAACSALHPGQWKRLLQWLSLASAGVALLLLSHISGEPEWMVTVYRDVFREGLGGNINKLGLALTYLTMLSWACTRISRHPLGRLLGAAGLALGYATCWQNGSRMAVLAPVLGILLGWTLAHTSTFRAFPRKQKLIAIAGLGIAVLSSIWLLAIRPLVQSGEGFWSDIGRINIAKCWISSLFTGHNRLIYGTGHSSDFIRHYCTLDKIFPWGNAVPSFGYAHNTFAQILGLYGLLGLSALAILASIYIRAFRLNYLREQRILRSSPRMASWTEVTLATLIAMLICAFAETSYHGDPVLQVLSGILVSFPLNPVGKDDTP